MRQLWYTAYVVSGLTYLALAYVEWQVPGFVSYVFPLYLLMITTLACGIATLVAGARPSTQPLVAQVVALLVGIGWSLLVFQAAGAFGAFRLILAIITLVLPGLLLKALSDVKE